MFHVKPRCRERRALHPSRGRGGAARHARLAAARCDGQCVAPALTAARHRRLQRVKARVRARVVVLLVGSRLGRGRHADVSRGTSSFRPQHPRGCTLRRWGAPRTWLDGVGARCPAVRDGSARAVQSRVLGARRRAAHRLRDPAGGMLQRSDPASGCAWLARSAHPLPVESCGERGVVRRVGARAERADIRRLPSVSGAEWPVHHRPAVVRSAGGWLKSCPQLSTGRACGETRRSSWRIVHRCRKMATGQRTRA